MTRVFKNPMFPDLLKDIAVLVLIVLPTIFFWTTLTIIVFDLARPAPCYDHHTQLCAPSEECKRHGY